TARREAIRVIAAPKIKLIRLRILRVSFDEQFLLSARQSQPQPIRNLPCDLFLYSEDIRKLAVIMLPPQLRALGDTHQIRLNNEIIPALLNLTCQDRLHLQLAPDLLRINLSPFVAKYSRAGHDFQLRQL